MELPIPLYEKQQLCRLLSLKREIEVLRRRMTDLTRSGEDARIPGLPPPDAFLSNEERRRAFCLARRKLEARLIESVAMYDALTTFIYGMDDPLMRTIYTLRYLDGLSWKRIAFEIGEYDESYPRRLHNRYLHALAEAHAGKGGTTLS